MKTRPALKLTLEGARAILAAAEKRAADMGVPQCIAVVDEGGYLLAFARMDGGKLSSVQVAITKALSAAIRRTETGPIADGSETSLILSLGLPMATEGRITPIRGGIPIVVEGQVVGGIGVSSGTEEQDVEVARAGLAAVAK